jgi:hypothetical protein
MHGSRITPEFFMGQTMHECENMSHITCVLEDEEGIVFFARIDRIESAACVSIQLRPHMSNDSRMRNMIALLEGIAFVEGALSRDGFEE